MPDSLSCYSADCIEWNKENIQMKKKIQLFIKTKKFEILCLLLSAMMSVLTMSCKENSIDAGGPPVIKQVRLVDPAKKDSTFAKALPGTLIVIQGENLHRVLKAYFNDFPAPFNAVMNTSDNLIITIPGEVPTAATDPAVSNKIRLVTTHGETSFSFTILPPPPVLSSLYCEIVKPNSETYLIGNYFYNVKSVKLGTTPLQVVSVTPTLIRVKFPAVITSDFVTVECESGSAKSTVKVNNFTGNMINFDIPATSWGSTVCWGDSPIIAETDADALTGKFARINDKNLPKTGYNASWVFATCYFDFKLAPGNATDKLFKFEHNVKEAWTTGYYEITLNNDYVYKFKPWDNVLFAKTGYKTEGWSTATIPLTEFKNAVGLTIADASKITDLKVSFSNPDAVIPAFNTGVDNFRIVSR